MKKAEDYKFTIGKNQRVMIEDLLQVFVDHQEYLRDFLEFLIERYGVNTPHDLQKISGSNLYHRLLECYLFKHQEMVHEAQKKPSATALIDNKRPFQIKS